MGRSNDGENEIQRRYKELCASLNMDKNATEEAWKSYYRISGNYTLEGDSLHWLACALYVACRGSRVPTVGKGYFVEGNCVSLTRLLQLCKLSLVQFFSKMKKWAEMASLTLEMKNRVDRLERNFNVSMVIFKKFEPTFLEIFKDPSIDAPRPTRSSKHRRPCTPAEVFSFCWTLFVYVKGNFPAIGDDLVNSFHLLLCCIDYMYGNALVADRRDLLNPNFEGLPENFNAKNYKAPTELPCILQLLCTRHKGLVIEAKGIKEHWWKPAVYRMITKENFHDDGPKKQKQNLKGNKETLTGVLDIVNFEHNNKFVKMEYERYVLNAGDFNECIFLGENANEEIGTASNHGEFGLPDIAQQIQMKLNLQKHFQESKSLVPSTPLTGRKFLKDREPLHFTPVSMATQSVSRLQNLLDACKPNPSDGLLKMLSECTSNPTESVTNRVSELGETFVTSFIEPSEDHLGSHIDFAKKRLNLGQTLYYKVLENILKNEKKRLPPNADLSVLLQHEHFHKSLFACCLEIVVFSYNSQRIFPWILEIYDLEPFYFYKVIELVIRAEEGLSRDVVKHLNHIEEQILESLAWKSDSPLWDSLKESGLPVPSCEEVSLPTQMESFQPSSVLASPISHPSFRQSLVRRDMNSPLNPTVVERFPSSPIANPGARRRLFGNENSLVGDVAPRASNSIPSQGRTLSITVQAIQENGITYFTVPTGITQQQTPPDSAHNTPSVTTNKPKRTGSIGLFFRKVYHLASVRLRDLCDRLNLTNEELRRRIWTCFEYSLMQHTDLMSDRHLDQLIMCAVYVLCKVTKEDKSFQEIMRCYRLQPQATSHVYRSVLLVNKKRRSSGSSDNSKSGSPASAEKDDGKKGECNIRSSSTLPVPHPNSQPPTPTRMGAQFDFEERGDIVTFYNKGYVPRLQNFAFKFSTQSTNNEDSPPLSPLPRLNASGMSPWRRVSSKHSIYISPLKNPNFPPSPSRPLSYSFSRSPAKDLRAINNMVRMGEKKVSKRILQDEGGESPSKKFCTAVTFRKLHNVMSERRGADVQE